MEIDWSEAPEWAYGHGLIPFQGIIEVWVGAEQYSIVGREGGPYPWGGGIGDTRHNHTKSNVEYMTFRPGRWSGEGRPPVGATCGYQHKHHAGAWYDGEILYISDEYTIVKGHPVGEQHYYTRNLKFRPIRTPEQIEAEERNGRIRVIEGIMILGQEQAMTINQIASAIDSAGYRKQKTTTELPEAV